MPDKNKPERGNASNSTALLAVRSCNQAAKMAGIIQRCMEATARHAPHATDGVQHQFILSAYGLMEGFGDMMDNREMVDHEDLEGVEELFTAIKDYLANVKADARP